MNKKLLTTTALVAVLAVTNAWADETISTDTVLSSSYANNVVITGGNVTANNAGQISIGTMGAGKDLTVSGGNLSISDESYLITFDKNISISGGSVSASGESSLHSDSGNISITGGNITLDDSWIDTYTGNATISGASTVINLNNDSNIDAKNLTINGGTINLRKGYLSDNESFTMTDGIINMTGIGEIGSKGTGNTIGDVTSYSGGIVDITGGTIRVTNGVGLGSNPTDIYDYGNVLYGNDIEIDGGTINIASGATLFAYEGYEIDESNPSVDVVTFKDKATLNLNKSTSNATNINLSGTLSANIDGDDRGFVNFKTSSAKLDGDITGASMSFDTSHSLSQAITGSIGDLNNLNINAGTLTFDKEPTGTITTVKVANGATLDIGDKILVSSGDVGGEGVIFEDNSTLAFTITDKTQYGKIQAELIDISANGTNLNLTLNGAALAKNETATFAILDSASITGAFANLSQNSRYTFVDNGDGTFDVTGEASASDIVQDAGGTANNAGTAEAWDSIDSGTTSNPTTAAVANALATLSNSATAAGQQAYIGALTSLAPETAPVVQSTSLDTTSQVFGAVGTRLSGGAIASAAEGKASGDSAVGGVTSWVQALFNKSKLDDTSKAKGFDSDSTGIALGFEKQLSSDVKAGIGYAYSQTDIDGFNRTTDVDTHTAILYGEYKPSNWYVNSVATYSFANYDEKKNVAGVQVKGDYDVDTIGLQAMTGYDFHLNGATLTPETGLRYLNVKQKSFTDTAGQNVSANSSDILTGVVGAKLSKEIGLNNGMTLRPEVKGALTYDLVNDDASSVVTLANGSNYVSQSEALDKFGMEFGAGVTADVTDRLELSVGYEGAFRKNFDSHTGLLKMKYKF